MNFYDLIRRIVEGRPFTDADKAAALRLLDWLEADQGLGELAGEPDHVCVPVGPWFPDSRMCQYCHGAIEPPEHVCEPAWDLATQTGEHGQSVRYEWKCVTCGAGMAVTRAG